jgi:Flp pilus assembly protein TadG
VPAGTRLRALLADRRGVGAVELALAAPVLLLLLVGLGEVGTYVLLNLKLQHAATALADLATRESTLTATQLDDLFQAAPQITAPFALGGNAVAIVTSVGADNGGGPTVEWQRAGAGTLAATSNIGTKVGGKATLPSGLLLRDGETIVAAELVYGYKHWLLGMVPDATLRRVAYYRPRLGGLRTLG